MRDCMKNRFVSMKGHNLVWPKVDLSTGLWECAEAAELISNMATNFFLMWLFPSFPLLIRHLFPYLGVQPLFIHDITSKSTWFSLFSTFSYKKRWKRHRKVFFSVSLMLRVIVGKHLVEPKLRHVKSRGSREDHAGVLRKGAKGKVRAGERHETIRIYEID